MTLELGHVLFAKADFEPMRPRDPVRCHGRRFPAMDRMHLVPNGALAPVDVGGRATIRGER